MGSGDPMLHDKARSALLAGCAAGIVAIAGCGAREPVEAPPAAVEPGYGAPQTPDLMGAPPSAEAAPADGLLGGPPSAARPPIPVTTTQSTLKTWRRPDGTLVTAMAPIANPERSHRAVRHGRPAPTTPVRRAHVAPAHVAPARVAASVAQVAQAPARSSARPATRPTPVAKPAPRPVAAAPVPAPLKPIAAAKPETPPVRAPIVAPLPPAVAPAPVTATAKSAPAAPQTRLQALQAAVAPEATRSATLATAPSLAQGQAGQVTLSLPATLGDLIRTEAAKLGLAKAARKASAYADLRGQGYEITPNGRQTAVVTAGQPATFAWQVKPTAASAKGPLKTEFGVVLDGAKPAQSFTLGSIARQVAPLQDALKEKAKGLEAAVPDLGRYETVDVPGLGKLPGKSLLGGALVLLALLILVAISRNASAAKARAERRRKFRTLTDYDRNDLPFETPRPAEGGHVNPMAAAAGGAAIGAVAAGAAGHRPPEHNPFEAPAHEDHGHGVHDPAPPVAEAGSPATPGQDAHARKELEPVD